MIEEKIGNKFLNCLFEATKSDKIDWNHLDDYNLFLTNIAGNRIEVIKTNNQDCLVTINDVELSEFTNSDVVRHLYNSVLIYKKVKERLLSSMQDIYKTLTGDNLINN
jgi:hypothetical protein